MATNTPARPEPVVTISASYGAGGSVIAPALAARLGLPLIDRLLTADISEEAARSASASRSGEGLSDAEVTASPGNRLFVYLARAASVGALSAPPLLVEPEDELRERAEAGLAAARAGAGAVVLGRAGAVVLAGRRRAFHVRLDGPTARRIKRAATIEGIPERRAADRLAETDRSRVLWVRRLYRADVLDPAWYHLWLDTTVLAAEDATDLIVTAVERFLAQA
jgi:cytidylate kinase